MSTNPPGRKMPFKDRRAAAGAKTTGGSLKNLKGMLGRPMKLQMHEGRLQMVLVERRRAPAADQPLLLSQVCAELRALLLAQEAAATQTMRHLVLVHDTLGSRGWPAVGALKGSVLRRALVQAEMLASVESSPALETVIEQLRPLADAAHQREGSGSRQQEFAAGDSLEVSESTYAEFEKMERSWIGTIPSQLTPLDRDN